jgi:hypothetical protein
VILIHFFLISTKYEIFQQTSQTILQSDSNSIENYFLKEAKIFLSAASLMIFHVNVFVRSQVFGFFLPQVIACHDMVLDEGKEVCSQSSRGMILFTSSN